jgi:hypothetical protein
MNTFGRLGQPRIRNSSSARIRSTESAALQEVERNSRRPAARRTQPAQAAPPVAPTLSPQEVEESNEQLELDPSRPLTDLSFQEMGILVSFRPTRIFQPRNVARNIKRIVYKLVTALRSLQERRLLKSDEALDLFKKIFLVHYICLGYHIDRANTPFIVYTDLLENDDWSKYTVGSFCRRRVQEEVLNAEQREELRMKRCEKLIKQGFISKAANSLQDKALPIPKNAHNRERLNLLHPPDLHKMGDLQEDGSIVDIILDQTKIDAVPKLVVDQVIVSRHIRHKKLLKTNRVPLRLGTSIIRN